MPLKIAEGNMYSWVTHMHTHLGGQCPHECSYCYVKTSRFGINPRYTGDLRLYEKELKVDYGEDKTIFIEHMTDLFAEKVPDEFIGKVIKHCCEYPENRYVFQTKNPRRLDQFYRELLPLNFVIVGTTVETDNEALLSKYSKAPSPWDRINALQWVKRNVFHTFITIEPIMKMDVKSFISLLSGMVYKPDFINIGADSKHCNLPEPSAQEVKALIKGIQDLGIEIKVKSNLSRIIGV